MAGTTTPAVPPYIGPKPAEYALPTASAILVVLAIVAVVQWSRLLIRRQRPKRALAGIRWVAYTRIPYLEIGILTAFAITAIFVAFLLYVFVPGQVYRAPKLSPAGLRAGYIAIALFPFVFTFGSRINPLAWITRVSHEKWMVYHQYGARIVLFFSLLHALLIIHSRYLIGGWDSVEEYWESHGDRTDFFGKKGVLVNGLLAAVVMVWMIFSSVFRHKSYEFFVIQHVISIILLIIALVAHLLVDLDVGINFVYSCIAVWGFSVLVRLTYNVLSSLGVSKWEAKAQLSEMPHGVSAIEVCVKGDTKWKAGQHVYLRLPGLSPFQSHPFTIARASTSGTSTDDNVKSSLRLLIKTRSGLTRKLASRAAANQITNTNTDPLSSRKGMRVIVEGPYGHLSERLEAFDDVLLIAGGVGGTFVWPIAEDLTRKGKKFKLIWTVKSASCLEWFSDSQVNRDSVVIHISDPLHASTTSSMTAVNDGESDKELPPPSSTSFSSPGVDASSNAQSLNDGSSAEEKDAEKESAMVGRHRLDMSQVVLDFTSSLQSGDRCAVLACGPQAMLADIGKAVTKEQWRIMKGDSGLAELWLHREQFGH